MLPGVFTHLLTYSYASVSTAPFSQVCLWKAGWGRLAWGGAGHWTSLLRGSQGASLVPWMGTRLLPPLCVAGSRVAGGNQEGMDWKEKEGERKRGRSQVKTQPVLSLFLVPPLIMVTVTR